MINNLKHLINSFEYAFCGILHTIAHERNMRVHMVAAVYVLLFSGFYNFSKAEQCVLFLIVTMVIITELFNTSVEAIVNQLTPQYSPLAKIAKDTAAASVLVAAVLSVVTGVVLFFDPGTIAAIWDYFTGNLWAAALLIASGVVSLMFILSDIKKKY